MAAPNDFRNSCRIEISCNDDGSDCQLIASCDLVNRHTADVHRFEKVIDLQPIVARLRRGFETYHSDLHSGGWENEWMRTARAQMAVKQGVRDSRSSQGGWARNPVLSNIHDQRSSPSAWSPVSPPPLAPADHDSVQVSDSDASIASQTQSDEQGEQVQDDPQNVVDEISGIARRIGAAHGVNELWRDVRPMMIGGWWSDIKHSVTDTVHKYAGDIRKAAVSAATSAAGPLGGKLANAIVDATLGKEEAKKVVAAVQQAAQTDPRAAAVLDAAQKAAAEAATAKHIAVVSQQANAGHPDAIALLANIRAAAASGDSAAQFAAQAAKQNSYGGDPGYASALAMMARAS